MGPAEIAAESIRPGSGRYDLLFLLAICLFAFGSGLGSRDFWDAREAGEAAIAWDALETGDWTAPPLDAGRPPLPYALAAAALGLFGQNVEFAARLPSAAFATGSVLVVYWLCACLFSRGTGLLSAMVLATGAHFIALGRRAGPDPATAFFVTAAVACFAVGFWDDTRRHWMWRRLLPLCAGLAFLSKGCVGLAVLAVAILGPLLWRRRSGLIRTLASPAGIPLFLLLAAGWWAWGAWQLDAAGRSQFFKALVAVDFAPWDWELPALALVPWTLFLVPAAMLAVRILRAGDSYGRFEILLCWTAGCAAVLAIFGLGANGGNAALAYPPAAVLCGLVIRETIGGALPSSRTDRLVRALLAACGLAMLAGAAVLALAGEHLAPAARAAGADPVLMLVLSSTTLRQAGAVVLGLSGLAVLGSVAHGSADYAFRFVVVTVLAAALAISQLAAPELNREQSAKAFAIQTARELPAGTPLYFYSRADPAIRLYARCAGATVALLRTGPDFDAFNRQPGPHRAILPESKACSAAFAADAGLPSEQSLQVRARIVSGGQSYVLVETAAAPGAPPLENR